MNGDSLQPESHSGSRARSRRLSGLRTAAGRIRRDAGYALRLIQTLRVAPPCASYVHVRMEGRAEGLAPFLAGTQTGLLYVRDGRAWRVMGGSVYGIASHGDSRHWTVFQRIPRSFGRLLKVDLETGGFQSLARFMSTGVHQIDVVKGRLAAADTYNNRILLFRDRGQRPTSIYPCGPLKKGRASQNYRHFNSVFSSRDTIYVVAHNQSAKTGRASEIFVLDPEWRLLRVLPTESGSAHNVCEIDGELWHCDSRGGSLVRDGEPVFREPGLFTRGLAVNQDHVLVGGSVHTRREDREATNGQVIVLDRGFACLSRIHLMGSGGVQEIRFLTGDLGVSGNRDRNSINPTSRPGCEPFPLHMNRT